MYYFMWLLSKHSLIKICVDGNDVDDIVTDLTAFFYLPPFFLHLLICIFYLAIQVSTLHNFVPLIRSYESLIPKLSFVDSKILI